jgi:fumarylacetoacetate (FAA) hydrolase family protein
MKDFLLAALPADARHASLVGRVWAQGLGPIVVRVQEDGIHDLSGLAATVSELLELPDPAAAVRAHDAPRIASTADVLCNSAHDARDPALPWLLAPCDLQAIKAAGVTFVASMLERVIEEQAHGDASKAEAIRQAVVAVIGEDLAAVRPGSPEALRLKQVTPGRIRLGIRARRARADRGHAPGLHRSQPVARRRALREEPRGPHAEQGLRRQDP